jgi:phosphoglycolate phosphatase
MIIFDWDGTLCDSVEHIVEAMQAAAAEFPVAIPAAASVRDIVGLGLPQAVARLFPGLGESTREALAAAYSRHYRALDREPPRLFSGAMETLLALRERGLPLAIATGKSRRGLDRVLGGLGMSDFFDATRCADETRSKPHPLMLEQIVAQSGLPAESAVMVGDSEYDLAMARAGGVHPVGVSYGVHSRERLSVHRPLAILDRLPELLDLEVLSRLH